MAELSKRPSNNDLQLYVMTHVIGGTQAIAHFCCCIGVCRRVELVLQPTQLSLDLQMGWKDTKWLKMREDQKCTTRNCGNGKVYLADLLQQYRPTRAGPCVLSSLCCSQC